MSQTDPVRHPTLETTRHRVLLAGGPALLVVVGLAVWLIVGVLLSGHRTFLFDATVTPHGDVLRLRGVGDATFVSSDDGRIHVHAGGRYRGSPPRVDLADGNSLITSSCPESALSRCRVRLEIAVPPDLALRVQLVTGSVLVEGLRSNVAVATDDGEVTVIDPTGPVVAETGNGNITVSGARSAQVRARSASGEVDMNFDAPPDLVDAHSGGGDVIVRIHDPLPSAVRTDAEGGVATVTVPVDPAAPRSIDAATADGDIIVSVR
ncbi:DUF4097 domain-containing protein [Rhodococcus sp. D2-41]|uniref:DUF4097 domain-containing protein n=1 Tax=Speluncibacter jeojiensis TaxID=2710754 RepID=A0A9X4M323_9ACTN|nr:hypothetical protein [Rhodococcus sp. D2-41]MDG3009413.1 DUF4097 domain-containing protein [Rhodococcus sp. D2-41]MDG3016959.1 hypothetical protein [Corynebacteriales bacterium D3-21]